MYLPDNNGDLLTYQHFYLHSSTSIKSSSYVFFQKHRPKIDRVGKKNEKSENTIPFGGKKIRINQMKITIYCLNHRKQLRKRINFIRALYLTRLLFAKSPLFSTRKKKPKMQTEKNRRRQLQTQINIKIGECYQATGF